MFATIDAFVTWLAKHPSVLFWVGYIGAAVFMRIFDALLSTGCDDYDENENTDDK